jgi:AcrR family transcriptional regulator
LILDVASTLFGDQGIRTSMDQIAEASAIQTGSLYHHFDSKEDIYVELVARYLADVARLADRALHDTPATEPLPLDQLEVFAAGVAEASMRNRAALLLTLYETPDGPAELAELAKHVSTTVSDALRELLDRAREAGCLRDHLRIDDLAERISESMQRSALGVPHSRREAEGIPALKCRVIIHGAARIELDDTALDHSAARRAADEVVSAWTTDEGDTTKDRIQLAARSAFARSGYELTTVRDIANEAGMSSAGVYRHIDSKDQLFSSIMRSFTDHMANGWHRVMSAPSTPLEKLDALLWLLAASLERFAPEYKMVLAGIRYAPPTKQNLGRSYQTRLRQLRTVLEDGARSGELDMSGSMNQWARCIMALISSMPESIVRTSGVAAGLELGRDTVLRGIAAG